MFSKVLLAIDVTHPESWEKALPLALESRGGSGELHVLGIVHDLGAAMVASYLPADFERRALEQMKAELDGLVAREIPDARRVATHVGHGHVAETILREAGKIGADLIVMAAHPPHEFQTFLVGSQVDKVVRHAAVPVLVVR